MSSLHRSVELGRIYNNLPLTPPALVTNDNTIAPSHTTRWYFY